MPGRCLADWWAQTRIGSTWHPVSYLYGLDPSCEPFPAPAPATGHGTGAAGCWTMDECVQFDLDDFDALKLFPVMAGRQCKGNSVRPMRSRGGPTNAGAWTFLLTMHTSMSLRSSVWALRWMGNGHCGSPASKAHGGGLLRFVVTRVEMPAH